MRNTVDDHVRGEVRGDLMGVAERRVWWLLWPASLAFGLTAEVIQSRDGADPSVVIDFIAAYAFVVAGLVAWRRRPENRLGRLMVFAGLVWFIGGYAMSGVDLVPSLAVAFAAYEPIAIAHVVLAYPEGRVRSRAERGLIWTGYTLAGLASAALLLTFNPRRDFACDCPSAPLGVLRNAPLVEFLNDNTDKISGAVVLLAVVLVVRRLLRATATQRRILAPLWIVATVAGIIFVVRTTASFLSLDDEVLDRIDDALNVMSVLIPLAFLAGLLWRRLQASPLDELVVALGRRPSGASLQGDLARTLRDPSVELAYWIPDRSGYVDAAGREFVPPDDRDRATTAIERDGERLAAIVHDRALLENPRLIEATAAAAGLALDNERLQAELRAQIGEVEASRIRLIAAGDAARRLIERDLHDGAQQRLLATALSLRMASDALDDGDAVARRALENAASETLVAVRELRELAHGIHPAILTQQGLRAAVKSLAERAPLAVTVDVPDERYDEAIESALYFVVCEGLANVAKHAAATRATVRGRHDGATLRVDIIDDGNGGASIADGTGLRGLTDRVVALDGRVELTSREGEGTHLSVVLPCS